MNVQQLRGAHSGGYDRDGSGRKLSPTLRRKLEIRARLRALGWEWAPARGGFHLLSTTGHQMWAPSLEDALWRAEARDRFTVEGSVRRRKRPAGWPEVRAS